MKPKIVVVGSANTDMIVRASRLPYAGETILGDKFMQSRGGKGANQAVAAARLGAEVTFLARLGNDHLGLEAIDAYKKEGINIEYVARDKEAPTGVALIIIDTSGEDMICVAPGANRNLSRIDILNAKEAIRGADCLLVQLEIPMETVELAIDLAVKYQVRVILNPAPMTRLPNGLLQKVNVITPNETEALALSDDRAINAGESGAQIKQKFGIEHVIVTMGEEGAYIAGAINPLVPAFSVDAIDATGAGDAFNGGLAVALSRGYAIADAVRFASAVSALATTQIGAQSSLPTAEEVEAFLERQAAV